MSRLKPEWRLIRPVDRCVVAVLARIVPAHAVIGKPIALAAQAECELVGRNRMTSRSPSLTTGVRTGERLDRQMHNVGNFDQSGLAIDAIFDWHLLHAEMFSDHWRKGGHRAPLAAAKDRCERGSLLLVGALVEIRGKCPVAIGHWPRRVGYDGDV